MSTSRQAVSALTWSTSAFTACCAAWMLNGVLVTFLVAAGPALPGLSSNPSA